VRGNNIKYLRIPEEVILTAPDEEPQVGALPVALALALALVLPLALPLALALPLTQPRHWQWPRPCPGRRANACADCLSGCMR
jgi:hypothetical protein